MLLFGATAGGVDRLNAEVADRIDLQLLMLSSYGTGTSARLSPKLVSRSDDARPGMVYW